MVVVAAVGRALLKMEPPVAALILTVQSDSSDCTSTSNNDEEAAPGAAAAAETAAATPQPVSFWRACTAPGAILHAQRALIRGGFLPREPLCDLDQGQHPVHDAL